LETKALFDRTVDTGLQHGTVTVLLGGEGYEVTTYRIDGEYEDSRHPKEVVFTANLVEDLKRRDFTINAMAYNEREGLVDAFDGMGDIERGVIRCVGDPGERFTEDALRMLRAVRFSAQLGFPVEEETGKAISRLAPNLARISAERIQAEMVKLLVSPHPEEIRTAWKMGITKVILPEFDLMMETTQNNKHHFTTVGEHTILALTNVPADKVLRLSVLFHDVAKPSCRTTDEEGVHHFYCHGEEGSILARDILHRWRFDNDTIHKVTKLVQYHDMRPALTEKSVRRAVHKVGEELFPLLLQVQRADLLAQSTYMRKEKLEQLRTIEELFQGILAKNQCLSKKQLAITGRDLIADGMKPGREMGDVLDALLEAVLECPEYNTREYLLEYSRTLRKH
jgi:tRNA nucleotidyltransferase (CCA-adding enzyme)